MEATWGAKFSLEHVEKVYSSSLSQTQSLKFAEVNASVSSEEIRSTMSKTTVKQSMEAPMKGKTVESIPEETLEEEKSEVGAAKGSSSSVDGSVSAPPPDDSDAFRIRTAASQPTNDKPANATKGEKKFHGDQNVKAGGLLDHLRIVFPSAYNLVVAHSAFEHIHQSASSEVLESPTITLDPHSLGNCTVEEMLRSFDSLLRPTDLNEAFLSEERCSIWRRSRSDSDKKSHWIELLKSLVQKSSDSVPLSVLVVARMEASAFAAYDEAEGAEPTNDGDTTTATTTPANAVADSKPEHMNETSNIFVEEHTRKMSRLAFHVVSEAVGSCASRVALSERARSMDHVRTLVPKKFRVNGSFGGESLVLLPFSYLIHGKEAASGDKRSSIAVLTSWNGTVEKALKTLIDDIEGSKNVEKGKGGTQTNGKSHDKHPTGQDAAVQTESVSQAPVKKNKKKKKKKVRNDSLSSMLVSRLF